MVNPPHHQEVAAAALVLTDSPGSSPAVRLYSTVHCDVYVMLLLYMPHGLSSLMMFLPLAKNLLSKILIVVP